MNKKWACLLLLLSICIGEKIPLEVETGVVKLEDLVLDNVQLKKVIFNRPFIGIPKVAVAFNDIMITQNFTDHEVSFFCKIQNITIYGFELMVVPGVLPLDILIYQYIAIYDDRVQIQCNNIEITSPQFFVPFQLEFQGKPEVGVFLTGYHSQGQELSIVLDVQEITSNGVLLGTYQEGIRSIGYCLFASDDVIDQRTFPSFSVDSSKPINLQALNQQQLPIFYGFQQLISSGSILAVQFDNNLKTQQLKKGGISDVSISLIGIISNYGVKCQNQVCFQEIYKNKIDQQFLQDKNILNLAQLNQNKLLQSLDNLYDDLVESQSQLIQNKIAGFELPNLIFAQQNEFSDQNTLKSDLNTQEQNESNSQLNIDDSIQQITQDLTQQINSEQFDKVNLEQDIQILENVVASSEQISDQEVNNQDNFADSGVNQEGDLFQPQPILNELKSTTYDDINDNGQRLLNQDDLEVHQIKNQNLAKLNHMKDVVNQINMEANLERDMIEKYQMSDKIFDQQVNPEVQKQEQFDNSEVQQQEELVQPEVQQQEELVNPEYQLQEELVNPEIQQQDGLINLQQEELVNPDVQQQEQFVDPEVQQQEQFVNPEIQQQEELANPENEYQQELINQDVQLQEQFIDPEVQQQQEFVNPEIQQQEASVKPQQEELVNPDVQQQEQFIDPEAQQQEDLINPEMQQQEELINPDVQQQEQFVDPEVQQEELVNPEIQQQEGSVNRQQEELINPDVQQQEQFIDPEVQQQDELVNPEIQQQEGSVNPQQEELIIPDVQQQEQFVDPEVQQQEELVNPQQEELIYPDVQQQEQFVDPEVQQQEELVNQDIQQQEGSINQQQEELINPDVQQQEQLVDSEAHQQEELVSPEIQQQEQLVNPDIQQQEQLVDSELQQQEQLVDPEVKQQEQLVNPDIQQQEQLVDQEVQQQQELVNPYIQQQEQLVDSEVQQQEELANPQIQQQEQLVNPEAQTQEQLADSESQVEIVNPTELANPQVEQEYIVNQEAFANPQVQQQQSNENIVTDQQEDQDNHYTHIDSNLFYQEFENQEIDLNLNHLQDPSLDTTGQLEKDLQLILQNPSKQQKLINKKLDKTILKEATQPNLKTKENISIKNTQSVQSKLTDNKINKDSLTVSKLNPKILDEQINNLISRENQFSEDPEIYQQEDMNYEQDDNNDDFDWEYNGNQEQLSSQKQQDLDIEGQLKKMQQLFSEKTTINYFINTQEKNEKNNKNSGQISNQQWIDQNNMAQLEQVKRQDEDVNDKLSQQLFVSILDQQETQFQVEGFELESVHLPDLQNQPIEYEIFAQTEIQPKFVELEDQFDGKINNFIEKQQEKENELKQQSASKLQQPVKKNVLVDYKQAHNKRKQEIYEQLSHKYVVSKDTSLSQLTQQKTQDVADYDFEYAFQDWVLTRGQGLHPISQEIQKEVSHSFLQQIEVTPSPVKKTSREFKNLQEQVEELIKNNEDQMVEKVAPTFNSFLTMQRIVSKNRGLRGYN